jgi:hypothetical protein
LQKQLDLEYVSPVLLAQVLLALQQPERAMDELERASEIRATDLVWLKIRPIFDRVRDNARVRKILVKIGLA